MAKIVRCEFLGSWLLFWIYCISIIGIPAALLYVLNGTIRIEQDLDEPEQFVAAFREGRLGGNR